LPPASPRIYQAALYPGHRQADYVARSAVFNFPDLIMVQARQEGPDSSDLIVYSRSVYGYSGLGVSHRRVEAWLAAPRTKIPSTSEK
jgi:uncharacterized protein (DUF1499 family)